ncbi:ABC transporter substrate-binding protein [Phyllobacterium myrsinacearum]|uniref:Multiple sugar transport system substrate-binding protein n=1 Tax=Phyllobacterium myrsinacearum TaxID=28101 RepID=A0A839EQ55_9HYPH|nr:extracellular solute-binding protein [Phyllobacterium myrsinacearum]MBA8880999.1 multiple sugar transport system substrate-binding protein [Phyllobacterium myrsinacearum]
MLNRRQLLQNGLLCGGAAALSQFPTGMAFADEATRLYWFGSPARAERTLAVVKLFETANPGIKINSEVGGNDYWSKLTTMIAGGNAPDIYQLAPSRFADYARRNATLPLDEFLGKIIRTDKLMPNALKLGSVDGKIAGIPLAINAFALLYDTAIFEQTGLKPPVETTTWDDFAKLCVELTKAIGKPNLWAVGNCARYSYALEAFLVQRGKRLYLDNGQIGFDIEDAKAWYGYWDSLSKAGGCVSAEIQALDKNQIDSNPMSKRNAAMTIAFSNQLVGYQQLAKNKIALTSLPILEGSGQSGLFYKASLHMAVANNVKNPELAAKFLDFFINDLEAGKALGVERGVPLNLAVRDVVAPTVDEVSKRSIDYISSIADRVGDFPPQVPIGASELEERVYRPIADKLGFGLLSVAEAAQELISQANRILKL